MFGARQAPRVITADTPLAAPDAIVLSPTVETKLQLQSVVSSHEGRFAVINGKLYKQGAAVDGQTLVSIADDWVLMEKKGEQYVLQISPRKDKP